MSHFNNSLKECHLYLRSMEDKLTFSLDGLEFHLNSNLQDLANLIYKTQKSINQMREQGYKYLSDERTYNSLYNSLEVYKLILSIREGKLSRDEFDKRVNIDTNHVWDDLN